MGGRPHPKGCRQIADSISVVHPEGAQREAAESQILLLLGTQREWNSESAGRARPTEGKMRSPTPCQEHNETNTKRPPPDQLCLLSYTGDHGRPADRRAGGSADSTQREAARSQILVLLGIQKASKERPSDRGFHVCWASRRRPKRGRRIADSISVGHPEEMEQNSFL